MGELLFGTKQPEQDNLAKLGEDGKMEGAMWLLWEEWSGGGGESQVKMASW